MPGIRRLRRTTAPFALVVLLAAPAPAQDTAVVERVVDGDTVVLAGGERVRLIGVDTPETVHPSRPVEAFGKEASAFIRRLLEGRTVRLEYDQQRRDRYDRLLAYVFLDELFVNEELIRQGYAHAYVKYPFRADYMDRFRALEQEARAAGRGLWADAAATVDEDSLVAAVRASIAGRENLPAEEVFEGIEILRGIPAGRVLPIMQHGFARSLGVGCAHCHDVHDLAGDAKPTKRIARQMWKLAGDIRAQLAGIEGLESERPVVNCTTCHRGQRIPATKLE